MDTQIDSTIKSFGGFHVSLSRVAKLDHARNRRLKQLCHQNAPLMFYKLRASTGRKTETASGHP